MAAALPLVLRRLGVDPAVVSAPLITTLVDGTGLIIYFEIARLVLAFSAASRDQTRLRADGMPDGLDLDELADLVRGLAALAEPIHAIAAR